MYVALYGPKGSVIFDHPCNADYGWLTVIFAGSVAAHILFIRALPHGAFAIRHQVVHSGRATFGTRIRASSYWGEPTGW